ncbi:imidazole glycerol phosphate synthase subunit HisH [Oceaniserpentilla sp. 4NH20-0058]|uniref:imidazole glycerol phosphate synthase subunit HisH n=1 Tax=Oceaniserpentilla sp. 4NH20-0058 TaxID=3127660 RepID=UPI003105CE7B
MSNKVVIIDYGCGNLFSVENAVKKITRDYIVSSEAKEIKAASKIILPGVGSFKVAMDNLLKLKLKEPILECVSEGKPILGICLGMQLLMSKGYEHAETEGLGLISGEVVPFIPDKNHPVPHIGWNDVNTEGVLPTYFNGIKNGTSFYFVHSFYCEVNEEVSELKVNYCNKNVVIGVQKNNINGVQFHPEKSQDAGIQLLKNFISNESMPC